MLGIGRGRGGGAERRRGTELLNNWAMFVEWTGAFLNTEADTCFSHLGRWPILHFLACACRAVASDRRGPAVVDRPLHPRAGSRVA